MSDPISHVSDSTHWHLFENIDLGFHLPKIGGLALTKFMVLEVLAAILIILIYVPLARRIRSGQPPKGPWWNFWEVLLTFIRDEVAKPNITAPHHHHDEHGHDDHGKEGHGHGQHAGGHGHGHAAEVALPPGVHYCDKYVPFLWTLFTFILINNLFGMLPLMGSATAAFTVTSALALITFCYMHGSAIAKNGVAGYLKSYVPSIDAPIAIGIVLIPLIVVIEVVGALIKAFVLSVRLFANIFAGHVVLGVIMLFIVMAKESPMFYVITPVTVLGVVALSMLELFVAFLQAFVFTFLTAIFLGAVLNPEH